MKREKDQGRTGSIDCTNSLTMPPKRKHIMPVNMSGE